MPATAPAATPAESPETGAEGIDAEGAGALTEPAPVVGFALAGAVPEPGTVELCPDAVLGAGVVPVSYTHLTLPTIA